MIYPKHLLFIPLIFRVYSHWMTMIFFHRQVIDYSKRADTTKPILVVSNHFSWWDGFWILNINQKLWKKRFYVMMSEEQLQQNKILSYLGAFSISRKDIRKSLELCQSLLTQRDTLLLIFPQGQFESISNDHLSFRRGTEYLIKNRQEKIQLIFVANFVDYYANKRPTVYSYCAPQDDNNTGYSLEEAYNLFYHNCITQQKERATP